MYIVCDTCAILMLIRIAPDMFIDHRFECVTLQEVREEIVRTQKFKTKYPWRDRYKEKLICLPRTKLQNSDNYEVFFKTSRLLINSGTENQKTKRLFNLSLVDIKVIAYALSEGHKVATGDTEIKDFAEQEFADAYKGSISPLGMINLWLQSGLIKWSDEKHDYLADWAALNEDPQPRRQKTQFRKLTGRKYPGS